MTSLENTQVRKGFHDLHSDFDVKHVDIISIAADVREFIRLLAVHHRLHATDPVLGHAGQFDNFKINYYTFS